MSVFQAGHETANFSNNFVRVDLLQTQKLPKVIRELPCKTPSVTAITPVKSIAENPDGGDRIR